MVVADTGPLHYLVLIGTIDILPTLYNRVLVPQTVVGELNRTGTPDLVRTWATQLPTWCEIKSDLPSDPALKILDPGERAAVTLALSVHANRLLIDDWDGRMEAERQRLPVIGTLGILAEAHQKQLLEFEAALERLRKTNFYLSTELINRVRQGLSARQRKH